MTDTRQSCAATDLEARQADWISKVALVLESIPPPDSRCMYCGACEATTLYATVMDHASSCPWIAARALVLEKPS